MLVARRLLSSFLPSALLLSVASKFLVKIVVSVLQLLESVQHFGLAFLVLMRLRDVILVHSAHHCVAVLAVKARVWAFVYKVSFQCLNCMEATGRTVFIGAWQVEFGTHLLVFHHLFEGQQGCSGGG